MKNAAAAIQVAYAAYRRQNVVRDAADYIEDVMKDTVVELRPGTVITVSSVMNAGFNGMQVGGYTSEGDYRIACFK